MNVIAFFNSISHSVVSEAVKVSLQTSLCSTAAAAVPGVICGLLLGLHQFKGRNILITVLYTMLAFPTVVIGLFVYLLLSRSGPFGELGLLYTKSAIVIGQTILIAPIIATFTLSSVKKLDPMFLLTARSLGARSFILYSTVLREARFGILASVIAAFGRAVSEVGVSMILGGNIAGITRTMTTAISLDLDKGEFNQVLILGVLLLTISLGINIIFHWFQRDIEDNHA